MVMEPLMGTVRRGMTLSMASQTIPVSRWALFLFFVLFSTASTFLRTYVMSLDRPHMLVITAEDSYFHGLRFVQPQMW